MNTFLYRFRLFNLASNPSTKLNSFFFNQYSKYKLRSLNNSIQEIFEFKDKSKYLSCSLVQKDIVELTALDNFKENYPFTVRKYII